MCTLLAGNIFRNIPAKLIAPDSTLDPGLTGVNGDGLGSIFRKS
jgi:hypothetical protein